MSWRMINTYVTWPLTGKWGSRSKIREKTLLESINLTSELGICWKDDKNRLSKYQTRNIAFLVSCFIDFISFCLRFKATGNPSQVAPLSHNRQIFRKYFVLLFLLISDMNIWVLKELSLDEILVEFAIQIWNFLIFNLVIIFIIIVIIVDVEQLVFAIFASVRNNHRDLCASIQPSCTGNDCRHTSPSAFACHKVDDCLRCWGKCGHHWDPRFLVFFPFPAKALQWWQNCRCSILVADSRYREPLDTTQPVCVCVCVWEGGGRSCDLAVSW